MHCFQQYTYCRTSAETTLPSPVRSSEELICLYSPALRPVLTPHPSALESISRWIRLDIELSIKWFSVIQDRNCQVSSLRISLCLFYLLAKDQKYMFDVKKWWLLGELCNFCIAKQIIPVQTHSVGQCCCITLHFSGKSNSNWCILLPTIQGLRSVRFFLFIFLNYYNLK